MNQRDSEDPSERPLASGNDADGQFVHQAYEALPYPAGDGTSMHDGAPLPPLSWIDSLRRGQKLNTSGTRILVAGCGSGAEAFRYQMACPQATVVGVDFSQRSIVLARQLAEQNGYQKVTFAVADLTDAEWMTGHEPFDFISLHGVVDYIPDAAAVFQTLAGALKPDGCLYAGVNGPGHHNLLYRRAFKDFGLKPDQIEFSDVDRERLRAIEVLMLTAPDDSVSTESAAYLASDVFTSQNHSYSIHQWLELSSSAGLHLLTSLDLAALLPHCPPTTLRQFLHLDRPSLSRIACDVQHKAFMRLLFTKQPPIEPPWSDIESLSQWVPLASKAVRDQLPKAGGAWEQFKRAVVNTPAIGKTAMFLSPAASEFIQRCDGTRTALEIWADLPQPCNWDDLLPALFSTFQAGMVHWTPPGNE